VGLGIFSEVLLLEIHGLLHKQGLISWGVALHHAWMVLNGQRLYIHNLWRIDSSLSRPALSHMGDMSDLGTDQPTPLDPK